MARSPIPSSVSRSEPPHREPTSVEPAIQPPAGLLSQIVHLTNDFAREARMTPRETRSHTAPRIAGAILLATALTGCSTARLPGRAESATYPSFPESPSVPWTPPPELAARDREAARATPPNAPADVSAERLAAIAEAGATVDLPTLIDLALRTSPQTRETWAAARSAAEEVGSRSAAYYPQVTAGADLERIHQSAVGGQFTFQITDYGPSLDLSYLLFSFGGRKADVEQARHDLAAADWEHNAAIQEVVLTVTQAYYTYLGEKALLESARSDLDTAETNLKAAQDRHDAGVATIADVLQAKTARSQAELDLRQVEGDLQATRGALATAIGVSPDVPVEAGALPEEVPIDRLSASIQDLLGKALTERPELAAARARTAAAREKVKKTRAEGLPTISRSRAAPAGSTTTTSRARSRAPTTRPGCCCATRCSPASATATTWPRRRRTRTRPRPGSTTSASGSRCRCGPATTTSRPPPRGWSRAATCWPAPASRPTSPPAATRPGSAACSTC